MTKIGYRVWYNDQMWYGGVYQDQWWNEAASSFMILAEMPDKDKIPLMRYTGLSVKDDRILFEGDVFQYTEHEGYLIPDFTGEVIWMNREACFGYTQDNMIHPFSEHDELEINFLPYMKVIGNIHASPELLLKTSDS